MLFERLVVTSVRPHPAFHRAQRACQLHPVTCQACCCCGSLSGAVGHAAPTDTSFCCLCAQIEPSHGRVRSSAGSCSTASSATAGACRSTIGTRYVNPSICSPSSHHQGSALTYVRWDTFGGVLDLQGVVCSRPTLALAVRSKTPRKAHIVSHLTWKGG